MASAESLLKILSFIVRKDFGRELQAEELLKKFLL